MARGTRPAGSGQGRVTITGQRQIGGWEDEMKKSSIPGR